ncbi:hypothetical protein PGIGA_G00111370 [Pangasianodon gigas]|uniref:Uncharacterized protein n=1 Tax=Pangasianodon gigas TaxID=30993 RepID=A0ACC5WAA1_PANGG|nr:hypothetical protein [Pangasianodon gigas]
MLCVHEGKRGGTATASLSPGLQVCLASAVETGRIPQTHREESDDTLYCCPQNDRELVLLDPELYGKEMRELRLHCSPEAGGNCKGVPMGDL